MTMKLSDREWEALSAYLDGQLSAKESTRLEERLQKSRDLRSALEELRRTRAVLRSQPRMRAPRNFTLTPEMVGVRRPAFPFAGAFSFLRLASAMASVLLILVLIGDFFTGVPSVPVAMQGAEAPAAEAQLEEAPLPEEEQRARELAPPGMGGEEAAQATLEGEILDSPSVERFSLTPEATGMPPAVAAEPVEEPAGQEAAGTMAEATEEGSGDISALMVEEGEAEAEVPAPLVEDVTEDVEAASPETAQKASPSLPWLTPSLWRIVEIALAVIAVTTGLAAFLLRRTSR